MSKFQEYFSDSISSQSPGMPVRLITGLVVIIFTFVWVPLGLICLLGLIWIVYVTKHPEEESLLSAGIGDILVPMDGLVTSINSTSTQKIIRISQQIHTNRLILMPIKGIIDINMFIDGLFLPAKISNVSSLNARREILIKTETYLSSSKMDSDVSIILWGSPFARYLGSPILEGRKLRQGIPIAISLFHGEIDIVLPLHYELNVTLGEFCIAGKTLLARPL